MKTINHLGHRWTIHKSSLGDKFVLLKRTNWLSDLKRLGQVATAIDVHKINLIK